MRRILDHLPRPVLLDVHRLRRPLLVLVAATALVCVFLYLVTLLGPPRNFLGIPGAGAVLIAVTVATLEGPWVGALSALIGGLAFFIITGDSGTDVAPKTAVYSTVLWTVAAIIAGIVADRSRREILEHEEGQARALAEAVSARDSILRVLELAPTFEAGKSYREAAQAVCAEGRRILGCDSASLLRVLGSELRLICQDPVRSSGGERVLKDAPALDDLRSELLPRVPLLVAPPAEKAHAHPSGAAALARVLGLKHALLVAPAVAGAVDHFLVLGWNREQDLSDPGRLAVIQRFADQAALALERAEVERLHARLEASLLPRLPLVHPRLSIATGYLPGERRLGLGGDFFDFLTHGAGRARFVIGDVSGHGPDAAALGAALRSSWRAMSLGAPSLSATLTTIDHVLELERHAPDVFATVLAGEISEDGREIVLVNAGHPRPILVTEQAVRELEVPSTLPVGFNGEVARPTKKARLPETWTLLLYTDGLIEGFAGPGTRERYGAERLVEKIQKDPAIVRDEGGIHRLLREIEEAHGGALPDDVAVLAITKP